MASRKTTRRTIKTVDDARQALVDLTPEGFSVTFDFHFSHSFERGHASTHVEFRAYAYECRTAKFDKFPSVTAHTPVAIVREYLAKVVPLFNPAPEVPAPNRGRRVAGKTVRRITYEPQPAFRPGDLFS